MKGMRRIFSTVSGLTLAVMFTIAFTLAAPPAHADEAGYLGRLAAAGVDIPGGDDTRIATGRYVCRLLQMYGHTGTFRSDVSPGDLVRQLMNTFYMSAESADATIQAARAELCP